MPTLQALLAELFVKQSLTVDTFPNRIWEREITSQEKRMATALEELRANPESAMGRHDFFVDVRGYQTTPNGVKCEIGGSITLNENLKKENGVTRLTIASGGTDFFFPWVNRGVGEVSVPINQPDGTIVVTGGMNGCSFQANRYGTNIIFYHDADSNRLGILKQPQGNQLCRIEPSLYQKIPYGETLMLSIGGGCAYLYQMICVRHSGKWKVMYSGIIIGSGIKMPILRSFTPGVSQFLASFED
jgi:hypothetical protein